MNIRLCTIDTEYVEYLQNTCNIPHVLDNKEESVHGRRYLGVVLQIEHYKYYVPLSSPKSSDYVYINGQRRIRRSIIPIMRIITRDEGNSPELKGKLKFSSMIPVPDSAISLYNISQEPDSAYKIIVEKEYAFIRSNQDDIIRHATVLYNQKTKENILYTGHNAFRKPGYLSATVDFKYAEQMHDKYIQEHNIC